MGNSEETEEGGLIPSRQSASTRVLAADLRYSLISRDKIVPELVEECRQLFNEHYGIWSELAHPEKVGKRIRLRSDMMKNYFDIDGGQVVVAHLGEELVGYAFATRFKFPQGIISWVTQLVVHSDYRNRGISKLMLAGIWALSSDFAWGLVSANPYAIRSLEKATRRRCQPSQITQSRDTILPAVAERVKYLDPLKCDVTATRSVADTGFHVDRPELPEQLQNAKVLSPWMLGSLGPSEEWLAVTMRDQPQISWTREEWEEFMSATRETALRAYDRMASGMQQQDHPWARYTGHEVNAIIDLMEIQTPCSLLDFGCGGGRHSIELATRGFSVTGVDFSTGFIEVATAAASSAGVQIQLTHADCRHYTSEEQFDAAICLYDVVGSFPSDAENVRIIQNLVRNLKVGGRVAISVMNRTLTERIAKNVGNIEHDPELILNLPPSNIMEESGNVFDPDYFVCDKVTGVVYRKEQFQAPGHLPLEMVVGDRRYFTEELKEMCEKAGLQTLAVRPVALGRWNIAISADDSKAKEILYIGRKSNRPGVPPEAP